MVARAGTEHWVPARGREGGVGERRGSDARPGRYCLVIMLHINGKFYLIYFEATIRFIYTSGTSFVANYIINHESFSKTHLTP